MRGRRGLGRRRVVAVSVGAEFNFLPRFVVRGLVFLSDLLASAWAKRQDLQGTFDEHYYLPLGF